MTRVDDAIRTIGECAETAQRQIRELYKRDPDNATFTQAGLLNGQDLVEELLSHSEWGIAVEHLLYMIHESDIAFEMTRVVHLHAIAEQFGIDNHYTRSNLTTLGKLSDAFNIPPT